MATNRFALLLTLLLVAAPAAAQQTPTGVPPDAPNPSVDPTRNVLDLVRAAIQRQDDLRAAQRELFDAKITGSNAMDVLRSGYDRMMLKAAVDRLDSEAKLRAEHAERLSVAEAGRINAIRAVDVNAVAVQSQRTTEQASALQNQTTQNAEVLRTQVARTAEDLRAFVQTTATAHLANQQQQFAAVTTQFTALSARITALEQSGAEGKGSARFQDPAIATLTAQVQALVQSRATTTGASQGQSDTVAWIVAVIMALIGIAGVGTAIAVATRRKPATR